MKKIVSFNDTTKSADQFDAIRISLASPEKIRSWSSGEIKKPETINYRTFKPEADGLFCAKIFGPMKDYECVCGKYKRMKYKGVVCEKCGVEVTLSRVRRERMGHIELAAPVAHIWFLKSSPSRLGLALDMPIKDLEKVLYFERYIVVEPGLTTLEPRQLLTEDEYLDAQDEFGEDSFTAMIGAESLKAVLSEISVDEEVVKLRGELEAVTSQTRRKQLVKKIDLFESLQASQARPEWMILDVLPVLPPELRPLVPLDGGRWAASDLNDFYRRVINRSNRLKRLIELRAPDIIVRNEKRMLQESVDALFDNGRRGKPIVGTGKRPLKSLSDMLKGKHGRFRQNLLGKRVDYSGRSVIVVGPELKLHECGLPKKMALELFKPFILAKLETYGHAASIKTAKKMIEDERPEVWDILDEVIHEHPVLLNRAPTLHRLGIQAFEPVLVEGKAIQLHPLVCTAFNADFDGDQMAVHVPLSIEAQLEARVLIMSTNNILSPANGKPIIVPSLDIVLGLYYLSLERLNFYGDKAYIVNKKSLKEGLAKKEIILQDLSNPNIPLDETKIDNNEIWERIQKEEVSAHKVPLFASISGIELALSMGAIHIQSRIKAIYEQKNEDGTSSPQKVFTTPGRMMLAQILPKHHKITFDLINCVISNKVISNIIDMVYRHCGQKETVIFCDHLMSLGFNWACKSGISFGKDDLVVPSKKQAIIAETQEKVQGFEQQYLDGLITWQERYNRVLDVWSVCSDQISNLMMKEMAKGKNGEINSIYMMADSGARGSQAQIKQLAGMRGLMEKPSGEIIERPIISNFKEGLNVLEYFNSTHGARKGLADIALKTANSGYLTRRLVDVAQDCVVTMLDCGATEGIDLIAATDGGTVIESLGERILGRTLLEDIRHPITDKLIAKKGIIADEKLSELIDKEEISTVFVRSPLACKGKRGICAACYGRDLARGEIVNVGEAVGVIAAQSIGEPGTQLTMRTFHIGGAVQGTSEQSSLDAEFTGQLDLSNARRIRDKQNNWIVVGRHAVAKILDENNRLRQESPLPYGSKLTLNDKDQVEKGDKIATWDPYTLQVITETDGVAKFRDLDPGVALREEYDQDTGLISKVVVDWRNSQHSQFLKPRIDIVDKKGSLTKLGTGAFTSYLLSIGAVLSVDDGQSVSAGSVIARVPRLSARARDITGGLPRVAELFEARSRRDPVVISEIDGVVRFGADTRRVQKVTVEPEDSSQETREYQIPKGLYITVKDGEKVKKGDQLVLGNPSLHDILRIFGEIALTKYLVKEVQAVYRLQGVKISDKHIEVIVRQMLCKVEVIDPGDTLFIEGEQVDRLEYEKINSELEAQGKKVATANLILLGITRASLQTSSFISAASFQETTRVLTKAATAGKIDTLEGLKENVIVGRLIPAGTGASIRTLLNKTDKNKRRLPSQRAKKAAKKEETSESVA